MAELSWDSFVDALNSNNVPEILLIVMGVVALAIVFGYKDDKDSTLYKVLVLVGVITGAFMVYVAMAVETGWSKGTLIVLTVAAWNLDYSTPEQIEEKIESTTRFGLRLAETF